MGILERFLILMDKLATVGILMVVATITLHGIIRIPAN
jgi:hypothetical protein